MIQSISGNSVREAGGMDEGSQRGKGEFARKYHSSITKVVPQWHVKGQVIRKREAAEESNSRSTTPIGRRTIMKQGSLVSHLSVNSALPLSNLVGRNVASKESSRSIINEPNNYNNADVRSSFQSANNNGTQKEDNICKWPIYID